MTNITANFFMEYDPMFKNIIGDEIITALFA
ncbi:hypothetical protein ALT785_240106 [Alteromonas infernus]